MGLKDAAVQALGEGASNLAQGSNQVSKLADAGQCLVSQAQKGKSPIFDLNPPSKNDASEYAEDNESISRGAAQWLANMYASLQKTMEDVADKAGKAVADAMIDPTFAIPGQGYSKRLGSVFIDLARSATALTLQKDQGHTVEKTAETLVKLSKITFQQAGSALYNEAPIIINQGRVLLNKAAALVQDSADNLVRADTEQHRVNQYVLTTQTLHELASGDRAMTTHGSMKMLQTNPASDTIIQSGKNLTIKAVSGSITVQAPLSLNLEAQTTLNVKALGQTTVESAATMNISGLTVNIKGAIVNIGSGSPGTPPTPPVAETAMSLSPAQLLPILPTAPDKKAGVLIETRIGANPPGVLPPRVSPSDMPNR